MESLDPTGNIRFWLIILNATNLVVLVLVQFRQWRIVAHLSAAMDAARTDRRELELARLLRVAEVLEQKNEALARIVKQEADERAKASEVFPVHAGMNPVARDRRDGR